MPRRSRPLVSAALVLLIAAASLPGASAAGPDPGNGPALPAEGADRSPTSVATEPGHAADVQAGLQEVAEAAGAGEPADRFLQAATLTPDASAEEVPEDVTFEEALARLYQAAGAEAPDDLPAPRPAVAEAVAPTIWSVARAAESTEAAYAPLTAAERGYLEENLEAGLSPVNGSEDRARRVGELASQVDVPEMTEGAAGILSAASSTDAWTGTRSGTSVASAASCEGGASSWVDPNGWIEIGSPGPDHYTQERVLIVDPAGNDCYENHAGSVGPGFPHSPQVSAVVDLAGDDLYRDHGYHGSSIDTTWGQGVGLGGIGLVADATGNDRYETQFNNPTPRPVDDPCQVDHSSQSVHRQMLYAQGVGVAGVGGIADLSGDDTYNASNVDDRELPCQRGKAYTFAQGVGAHGGVGVLIEASGADTYEAYAEEGGKDDNLAHTQAQAVASGGVGVLADGTTAPDGACEDGAACSVILKGNDAYQADAYAHGIDAPEERFNGAFAYVFAQGSTMATRERPKAGLAPSHPLTHPLPSPCLQERAPTAPQHERVQCPRVGAALLADTYGADRFEITADSDEPDECRWASWAVASGQGSAAWSGIAGLVNLDVTGEDVFTLESEAVGGCDVLGVRSYTHGQGYGGPLQWDVADHPTRDAVNGPHLAGADPIWTPAVGVLASGDVPDTSCRTPSADDVHELVRDSDLYVPSDNHPPVAIWVPPIEVVYPCHLLGTDYLNVEVQGPAHDRYEAESFADNHDGDGVAETWAQGVGGNLAHTPAQGAPAVGDTAIDAGTFLANGRAEAGTGLGLGIHLDASGPDTLNGTATAWGIDAHPLVVAQGAGVDGVGVQANAGGDDAYRMEALANGDSRPGLTHGQAYAKGQLPTVSGSACILAGAFCTPSPGGGPPAVGVEVDLGGQDTYSETPCRADGTAANPQLWGTIPAPGVCTGNNGSGLALGVDTLSGV